MGAVERLARRCGGAARWCGDAVRSAGGRRGGRTGWGAFVRVRARTCDLRRSGASSVAAMRTLAPSAFELRPPFIADAGAPSPRTDLRTLVVKSDSSACSSCR